MDGNGGPGRPPFRPNHGAIVHFSTLWPAQALKKKALRLRGRFAGSKFRLPRPFGPWQGGANPRVVGVGGCFLPCLGPPSDHPRTVLGPCSDHPRTVLGPCSDRARTVLGPPSDRAWTVLGPPSDHPCTMQLCCGASVSTANLRVAEGRPNCPSHSRENTALGKTPARLLSSKHR
jgi:hypothetical protein